MVDFREEAVSLAKQIVEEWDENEKFETIVTIIQDYITDMDTNYQAKLERLNEKL
jgi:hypothetical protein